MGTKGDSDYVDFSRHLGCLMRVLGLFSAFTFTLICLIITQIADPSLFHVQVLLLFLSVLFYLSLYLLADTLNMDTNYCGNLPPLVGSYKAFEYALFVLFNLFALTVPMLFLSWHLYLLAVISSVVFVVFSVLSIKFIVLPLLKARKPQASKGDKSDQT